MSNHSVYWNGEEDGLVIELVNTYGLKKWNTIANRLNERMNNGRNGKQCRERWHNHLDPSITKQPWTIEEQNIMFKYHQQLGNRWSQISQYLPGRTDNNIKNYFYSTLRRSLRRINKLLGSRNSTIQIKTIKPHVLSSILNSVDIQTEQLSHESEKVDPISSHTDRQQIKHIISTIVQMKQTNIISYYTFYYDSNQYNNQKKHKNRSNTNLTMWDQETKISMDEQYDLFHHKLKQQSSSVSQSKFTPTLLQPIPNTNHNPIESSHNDNHRISHSFNNVLIKSVDSPFNYHKQYI